MLYFGGTEASSYFKLYHISWLYNELPGGQDIMCLVLLLIWPVEVK